MSFYLTASAYELLTLSDGFNTLTFNHVNPDSVFLYAKCLFVYRSTPERLANIVTLAEANGYPNKALRTI